MLISNNLRLYQEVFPSTPSWKTKVYLDTTIQNTYTMSPHSSVKARSNPTTTKISLSQDHHTTPLDLVDTVKEDYPSQPETYISEVTSTITEPVQHIHYTTVHSNPFKQHTLPTTSPSSHLVLTITEYVDIKATVATITYIVKDKTSHQDTLVINKPTKTRVGQILATVYLPSSPVITPARSVPTSPTTKYNSDDNPKDNNSDDDDNEVIKDILTFKSNNQVDQEYPSDYANSHNIRRFRIGFKGVELAIALFVPRNLCTTQGPYTICWPTPETFIAHSVKVSFYVLVAALLTLSFIISCLFYAAKHLVGSYKNRSKSSNTQINQLTSTLSTPVVIPASSEPSSSVELLKPNKTLLVPETSSSSTGYSNPTENLPSYTHSPSNAASHTDQRKGQIWTSAAGLAVSAGSSPVDSSPNSIPIQIVTDDQVKSSLGDGPVNTVDDSSVSHISDNIPYQPVDDAPAESFFNDDPVKTVDGISVALTSSDSTIQAEDNSSVDHTSNNSPLQEVDDTPVDSNDNSGIVQMVDTSSVDDTSVDSDANNEPVQAVEDSPIAHNINSSPVQVVDNNSEESTARIRQINPV
ncbi:hypothetical protein J3Q64DRAFT_1825816 [Phycomyces blakesleeanus]|uniref:Uncharacterized protein n=1 Tax=Phycomyces blakesleeanus TaxID=4837 RepID=A0ABR3AJP1_PHYBL